MDAAVTEWARCRPWIEAALKYDGLFTMADVEQQIEEGRAHFWPGRNAAMVTQFVDYPHGRAGVVWLCGGDMAEVLNEMQPVMEAWAKAHGCCRVMIEGRRGWIPALRPHGYEPMFVTMIKDLV